MKKLALSITLLVLTTGCVTHTWAPGPTATMPFEQASGRCKLVAMGADQGFVAVGNANEVAGAAIGNGLGNAIRENQAYNACMEAMGFVATDTQARVAAAATAPVTVPGADGAAPIGCSPGQPCSCGGAPNMPVICQPN
ncbi:MAG TPA: hypothetical protein VME41_14115 [Stellaceae bacterium]|nr:hypothetical protein [Stellaceae bacterium]